MFFPRVPERGAGRNFPSSVCFCTYLIHTFFDNSKSLIIIEKYYNIFLVPFNLILTIANIANSIRKYFKPVKECITWKVKLTHNTNIQHKKQTNSEPQSSTVVLLHSLSKHSYFKPSLTHMLSQSIDRMTSYRWKCMKKPANRKSTINSKTSFYQQHKDTISEIRMVSEKYSEYP